MLLLAGQLIKCREQIREMTRGTKAYPRPGPATQARRARPAANVTVITVYDRRRPGQFPQASGPGEGPAGRQRRGSQPHHHANLNGPDRQITGHHPGERIGGPQETQRGDDGGRGSIGGQAAGDTGREGGAGRSGSCGQRQGRGTGRT
jgi:hypothetical protein